jgi:hypothetical protein
VQLICKLHIHCSDTALTDLDLGTMETEAITTREEGAENVVTLFVHSLPHKREEGGGRRGRDVSSSLAA